VREVAKAGSDEAFTERVVTHVARLVSIGQLPSGRADFAKKSIPLSVTGWWPSPIPAKLIVTKLVNGVASRNPPLVG
jgi:hypothetical protein